MEEKKCRWGILGTAGIARKNWQAIRHAENAELVAVASRTEERAAEYIAKNQEQIPHDPPPRPIAGYNEMIAAEDIDAIYIPLPTGVRKEYVLEAAAAGKHILCEKPCGIHADDLEEMIAACESAGVQFMDGVMFMHSARLPALRKALDDGESVGEVKRIVSQFTFRAPDDFLEENIRMHSGLEPLGSLGDLGWYCIRIALWTMNFEMPVSVMGRMIRETGRSDSPDSVPVSFSAEMTFAGGATASYYCSFETELQQWANISGTKGLVSMNDFVVPCEGAEAVFQVEQLAAVNDLCNFYMEEHTNRVAVHEHGASHVSAQETGLFRTFSSLVLSGKTDSYWPEVALKTQQVLDACLLSAREKREIEL